MICSQVFLTKIVEAQQLCPTSDPLLVSQIIGSLPLVAVTVSAAVPSSTTIADYRRCSCRHGPLNVAPDRAFKGSGLWRDGAFYLSIKTIYDDAIAPSIRRSRE